MLNNNFKQLARKYELYRRNRIKKISLSIIALIALLIVGFFMVFNSKNIVKSFQKAQPETTNVEKQIVENIPKKIDTKKEIDTIKKEQEKAPVRVVVETPKSKNLPTKVYKRDTKELSTKNQFKLEVHERKNLYNLLTNHKKQNTYQTALALAEFHFKEKNYTQAVTWSVKASKKNPKNSSPWILYAKSKAALGKTAVAKKALSIYLKHTKSTEAQELLNSLK